MRTSTSIQSDPAVLDSAFRLGDSLNPCVRICAVSSPLPTQIFISGDQHSSSLLASAEDEHHLLDNRIRNLMAKPIWLSMMVTSSCKAIVHNNPSSRLYPSPKHVCQNTAPQLHRTQTQRRSPHDASQIEPLYKVGRPPPHGIQHVRATKGRAPEGGVFGEAVDVGVRAAKERDGENRWPLEWLEVLCGDEGGEDGGRNRGLCAWS